MILKVISGDATMLEEIAIKLLKKKLLANATLDAAAMHYEANDADEVVAEKKYILSGISKSLLFKQINSFLRETYGESMPLLYSEPIIMFDPEHTDQVLSKLIKT